MCHRNKVTLSLHDLRATIFHWAEPPAPPRLSLRLPPKEKVVAAEPSPAPVTLPPVKEETAEDVNDKAAVTAAVHEEARVELTGVENPPTVQALPESDPAPAQEEAVAPPVSPKKRATSKPATPKRLRSSSAKEKANAPTPAEVERTAGKRTIKRKTLGDEYETGDGAEQPTKATSSSSSSSSSSSGSSDSSSSSSSSDSSSDDSSDDSSADEAAADSAKKEPAKPAKNTKTSGRTKKPAVVPTTEAAGQAAPVLSSTRSGRRSTSKYARIDSLDAAAGTKLVFIC